MIEQLTRAYEAAPEGIENLDQLQQHLQIAIELEHATIPPYLCALYSIKDGHNEEAARIIRSVVMEEMLHVALAANVLKAIGGTVRLTGEDFLPRYPAALPHSARKFQVSLEKFSRAALRTFLKIEHPATRGAPPQAHGYSTIAQFYAAIEDGLKKVCAGNRHFDPKRHQVWPRQYYGATGSVIRVTNLDEALRALEEIVNQGEGRHDSLFTTRRRTRLGRSGRELAHYFRFNEIYKCRLYNEKDTVESGPTGERLPVDWKAVHDMEPNPKAGHFRQGSEARRKMDEFNRTYMALLRRLEYSFNEAPQDILECVGGMYDLKYKAVELMNIPYAQVRDSTTPGAPRAGMLGPSFEYIAPAAAANAA
jgi:hypothetical protein